MNPSSHVNLNLAKQERNADTMEVRLDAHARDMAQGIFELQDVLYYVLFCAFFLFLTFRALESRHWRS